MPINNTLFLVEGLAVRNTRIHDRASINA